MRNNKSVSRDSMANGTGDVVMPNEEHKHKFDETSDEMKGLIGEMRELNSWYQDEVSKNCGLEEGSECETYCIDCLHESDTLMNCWIMDLTEQNGVILNLIKETKEQGNNVVKKLEKKLSETKVEAAKVKLEKQKSKIYVDNLLYEKNSLDQQYKKIQEIKKLYNSKRNKINEKVRASETQLNNLHKLSHRLQSTGAWDIQDLQLDKDAYDKLFKENPEIIGGPCIAITEKFRQRAAEAFEKETLRMDIRLLNENIKNKNKEIDKLKEKMQFLSKKGEKCGEDVDIESGSLPECKTTAGIVKEMQTTVNITDAFKNPNNNREYEECLTDVTDEFLMV